MKWAYTISIYYGIRALFYILIIFADNPNTPQAFIFFLIIYISNGLLNIVITSYFYKVIKKEHKGSLSGLFIFFANLGIMIMTKLGILFFDHVSKSGPFLLGAGFDISFIIIFLVFQVI